MKFSIKTTFVVVALTVAAGTVFQADSTSRAPANARPVIRNVYDKSKNKDNPSHAKATAAMATLRQHLEDKFGNTRQLEYMRLSVDDFKGGHRIYFDSANLVENNLQEIFGKDAEAPFDINALEWEGVRVKWMNDGSSDNMNFLYI